MRALVTGATGLLGGAIVRSLAARGDDVVALPRSGERAAALLGDTATVTTGDLRTLARETAWLRGVDVVFHCAAYFREYYAPGDHDRALRELNVDAVRELLHSAARAEVGTVVHTSTIGFMGAEGAAPATERAAPDERAMRNGYHASKAHSELVVREVADRLGLCVPMLRPGWMFGPGDAGPTASGRLVLSVARGELPAVPPGGNHVTDARDVAAAAIAAAERGRSGQPYVVAGPWRSMADIVDVVALAAGRRGPRLAMPTPAALAFATISELVARVRGTTPLATRDGIRALLERRRVSSALAEHELGASFRPFTQTVADELAWYRETGRLPPTEGRPAPRAPAATSGS